MSLPGSVSPLPMDKPPVAAITGGTGFIGQYVAAALAEAGWQVRLLCRRDVVHPRLAKVPLELVLGDLADPASLARLVRGAEAVVHLAGLTKAADFAGFLQVNRDGSARLAEAVAAEAPGARCILVSSMAARAPGLSAYAASKRAGEEAVRQGPGGACWTILRPGVVYGPGDIEGRALRGLASGALAPVPPAPEARLAMIHAQDLAEAIVALCGQDLPGGLFELSDAEAGYGFLEILRLVARLLGRSPPRALTLPDAVFRLVGDGADLAARLTGRRGIFGRGKANELLHRDWAADPALALPASLWRPRITLEVGMAETVAWWRQGDRAAWWRQGHRAAGAGRG